MSIAQKKTNEIKTVGMDRNPVSWFPSEWRFRLCYVAAIFGCLFLQTWCIADTITLTTGTVIEGRITKQTDSCIVLEHEELGKLEIPSSRIKSIIFDRTNVEVVLIDGNTITGKIIDQNEVSIRLEREDLVRIDVPTSRIKTVIPDLPDVEVVIVEGDNIKGKMIERNEDSIVLEHPTFGRLEIPRSKIRSVIFEKKTRAWFNPKWLNAFSAKLKEEGWNASVDFSLSTADGNVKNEKSIRLGVDLQRVKETTRLIQDLTYYRKDSRGDTTDNKLKYGISHDWLLQESPWFYFVAGRFDYDEFMSWQERLAAYAGPAYHLIRTDDVHFDVRVGLGGRKEWGSENDDYKFEAAQGLRFKWDMTSRQKVVASTNIASVVGDLDDYRGRSIAEWQLSFDRDMRLSLFVGVDHEYISIVDPGDRHSDTRVHMGIRYAF